MRSAAVWIIVSVVGSALSAQQPAAGLTKRLLNTSEASSLQSADLKPWHMKLAVQLFDEKGKATEQGSVEEWWSKPGVERVVYNFPSYQATHAINPDGVFRTEKAGRRN